MSLSRWNSTCEICGESKNRTSDHAECSKLKQEMHKSDKRKAAQKKLTRKNTDSIADFFREPKGD